MYTQMFIATLFIIAKRWKPPKYPPMFKWINSVVYQDHGILFSHKMNEVYAATWMNLKNIMLVKEAGHKNHIRYDSGHMKDQNRKVHRGRKEIHGCVGLKDTVFLLSHS